MITGEIRNRIDRIWDAFWAGGIANPLEVIEQITYLLFLRRLDDLHRLEENKSARLKKPMEHRVFPVGKDPKKRPYEDFRWSRFKHFAPADMYTVLGEHVFPFMRTLGGDGSTYAHHMKDARFTIPTPGLLAKVVDLIDGLPLDDRDTKGDLYEYMLAKIASAGQNGQFRTPRHIIRLMGEVADHRLGKMLDAKKNRGRPLPFVRNPNVRWFEVDTSNLREMPFEDHELDRYGLIAGDVLVCEGGEAGRAAIWDGRLGDVKFQKALHRVRPGPDLLNRYLVHQLKRDYESGRLAEYYTGATIKHLTGQDLARYQFPLPPLAEQRRIVEVLDRAEALRAKRRAALARCDSLTQ